MDVRIKRVYDEPSPRDGFRVLVDRLWPRGISRQRAALDDWDREIAPSPELRMWFAHQPERFDRFSESYLEELRAQRGRLSRLRSRAGKEPVTLLYAARDPDHNHAVVLAQALRQGVPRAPGRRVPASAGRVSR